MAKEIIFGEIEGIEEGHIFLNRQKMMPSSFHRNWGAGIDGNGREGVSAIVLSGGYEDDLDLGDEIIYTGAGSNDSKTGKQLKDQSWDNRGNAGLLKSMDQGLPVRVVRGYKHKSTFSPLSGYQYAGLFSVVDAWEEIGKSGFKICRFRLVYIGLNPNRALAEHVEQFQSDKNPKRKETTVLRIIRDTVISRKVKLLYNYECQVCGQAIATKSGRYAEGAHIKPLGKPHNGEDNMDNLLCLCPNHHVMFDKGMFSINDAFQLIGDENSKLILHKEHLLNNKNLQYHRYIHGHH